MPVNRFFSPLSVCFLSLTLVLSGCAPQPSVPDPLPASLRVDARPDSVIALPGKIDFSSVSEIGQGPTGSLIRRNFFNPLITHDDYSAYTYDEQRRLIGTFSSHVSSGYNELILARYQGATLTETYTGSHRSNTPYRFTPYLVTKYQYDANQRLGQVLIYENEAGVFKLHYTVQYEYDASGQLQLSRLTGNLADSSVISYHGAFPYELRYWADGDYYRLETYQPFRPATSPANGLYYTGITASRFFYTQVSDPIAQLDLRPQYSPAKHYPLGSSASGPEQDQYQYRYQYDTQGRLTYVQRRQRIDNGNIQWTEWDNQEFVYAP
jgi:hypothetical protein